MATAPRHLIAPSFVFAVVFFFVASAAVFDVEAFPFFVNSVAAAASFRHRRRSSSLSSMITRVTTAAALASSSSKRIASSTPSRLLASTTTTMNIDDCDDNKRVIKVAVIGGGAAGLATLRALTKCNSNRGAVNFDVKAFEARPHPGGVWLYDDDADGDNAKQSNKDKKERPMYAGLRTNLPKEVMQFRDKPWTTVASSSAVASLAAAAGSDQVPSYVTHRDVLQYLNEYASDFDLLKHVNFDCQVTKLSLRKDQVSNASPSVRLGSSSGSRSSCGAAEADEEKIKDVVEGADHTEKEMEEWPRIELEWRQKSTRSPFTTETTETESATFDAVCVCNGHYASPSSPPLPGLTDNYHGRVLHSIEYDLPQEFKGQTVLCIGGRASGSDLAREISMVAKRVYLSGSDCKEAETLGNLISVPKTTKVDERGQFHFDLNCDVIGKDVDAVIFCTGYDYRFSFLTSSIMERKDENEGADANNKSVLELNCIPGERRVSPLYEQLFHAVHPNAAFLGLPHSVVPFPLFELQAEACAAQWGGVSGNGKALLNGENAQEDGTNGTEGEVRMLPSLLERMEAAEQDAASGGPNEEGRVQDTHFLGSAQWEYCRTMAKLAGVYDEETENYIATNKAIYDHAGGQRKKLFPGGPDTYRSTRYVRDDANRSFEVILAAEELTSSIVEEVSSVQ